VLLSCSANLAVPLSSMKTNLIFAAIVLVARTAIAQAAGVGGSAALLVPEINPTPDQIVRVQQLPSVAAIANAAESQGVAIRQIFLTSGQVTVVYKYNDGRITTLCYQLPPAVGLPPSPAATVQFVPPLPASPQVIPVVVPASPTVVYEAPAYAYDSAYYPWLWSAPIGTGYGSYYHRGYDHGGSYRASYDRSASYRNSYSRGSVRSWR
jgi:hypothetical protein